MTFLKTIDHSKVTGYLRNYDPIKQYFCLLPHNHTFRPQIVPQENLVHFDDLLLPCNIPTLIVKPLTVFKQLVSSPLHDKDTSYHTALSKQPYSNNELLFISAKVVSFMVESEQNSEHKSTHLEHERAERHTSPSRTPQTTTYKMTVMLSRRTLKDITEELEPYKRPKDTPLKTPTRLVDHYERTSKLLP